MMNLLLLSPEIQEQVLLEQVGINERGLRKVVAESSWERQVGTIAR